ncbi:MAG TPA: hypothetical protein VKH37_02840, partial [Ferruginibacter sp.]|nr:hypothetical protein [Ferruginibacter sp.]
AGAYYVQEASSMFLEQALKQSCDLTRSLKVLDLCAAPGGKSTLIQSLITHDSLLVSNEVIKTRVNILEENIVKWGAANVVVTNNDPKDFQRLHSFFDIIVVDAPCSGSGLFRRDPDAINEWSEQNVELCSQRQQRILADSLPALKEGGVLIYSTCSYSKDEDEAISDWLIDNFGLETLSLQLESDWGIFETRSERRNAYGYRFFPDKVKGEGFFIAVFKKSVSQNSEPDQKRSGSFAKTRKEEKLAKDETIIANSFIADPDKFSLLKLNDEILAIPVNIIDELSEFQSNLYIKKAGTKIGTVIRGELIPDHELAMGTIIKPNVKRIEVDETTAIQYLQREDIKLPETRPGWWLISFQGLALGWVKILPNRINNYYPKNWRILNKR